MKLVRKYIPCKITYILKWYLAMVLLGCLITYIESCPLRPFSQKIIPNLVGPSIAFLIVCPLLGLFFTQKKLLRAKFSLPYNHIQRIQVSKDKESITLYYHYNPAMSVTTEREHHFEIELKNYQTTLSELLSCFPENIPVIYDKD